MKKQVLASLIITLGLLIPIILINFVMDSMWTFNHEHPFNNFQESPNERQQKSNKLYFTDKHYDTLILGSSRTTYMNQERWEEFSAFNFAVGDVYPDEYKHLINFAIHDSSQPIKNVIIGADFFAYFMTTGKNSLSTDQAMATSKSPYYRYKLLLSADATRLSLKNIRNYFMPSKHFNVYTRSNIKLLSKRPDHTERLPIMIKRDLRLFESLKYTVTNRNDFMRSLTDLKNTYPDINFIVFTTPVTMPLFENIIKNDLYPAYENWLRDLVDTFGEVHHFMYKNKITINYEEYFDDAHHSFSATQDMISKTVQTNSYDNHFGMRLDQHNIDRKLALLQTKNLSSAQKN